MAEPAELVQEFRDVITQAMRGDLCIDLGSIAFSRQGHGDDFSYEFRVNDYPAVPGAGYGGFILESYPHRPAELRRTLWAPSPYILQITSSRDITEPEELQLAVELVRAPHLRTDALRALGAMTTDEATKWDKDYQEAATRANEMRTEAREREQRIARRRAAMRPPRPVRYK